MSQNGNHIVAKVSWNTSFDWREKAIELQDRISAWSNTKMPRNVVRVFDKFCPTAQTWKIESLTIDLGKIDYDNLEAALDKQLTAQLNQKLVDLILNGNGTNLQLDIEENQASQLHMLRYFLLHGTMPWNCKNQGSINELFASLLKVNLNDVADLLRAVGKNSSEVRKRIAWQNSEANLIEIVKALEPNHHEQVVDFSKEIIRIKTKENSIQGSEADFKKNLWVWILDYLLAERGSLFNKIAFLKSNILQMAKHYNISYNELLILIKDAVKEVGLKKFVKHELLQIIDELTIEKEIFDLRTLSKPASKTNYWTLLKQHLLNHTAKLNAAQKSELNDLVINLAKLDPTQFATLILSLAKQEKWLTDLAINLNEPALTAIFFALNPSKAGVLLRNLDLLMQLNRQVKFKNSKEVIWQIGLKYLFAHRNTTLNNALFLNFYLDELVKKTGLKKERIAHQLITANISSTVKNVSNLESYLGLTKVLKTQNRSEKSLQDIAILIEMVVQLNTSLINREKLAQLSNELLISIKKYPKAALNAFVNYSEKAELEKVFPYLLDKNSTVLLLQNLTNENLAVFSVLQKLLKQLKKDSATHEFAVWLNENLVSFGIEAIIFHTDLKQGYLVNYLLRKIKNALPSGYTTPFKQFVYVLAKEKDSSFVNAASIFQKNKKQLAIEQLGLAMAAGYSKSAIVELLAGGLKSKEYSLADLQRDGKIFKIINYVLTDGGRLYKDLVKEYTNLLEAQLPKNKIASVQNSVNALFWECLIAFNQHYGNKQSFRKIYKQTIVYHFKLQQQLNQKEYISILPIAKSTRISLKNGSKITAEQLLILLEACLKTNSKETTWQTTSLNFAELLTAALEYDSQSVKNLIVSFSVQKNRVKLFYDAIPFDEFSFCVLASPLNVASEAIKSLNALYSLTTQLLANKIPANLLYDFWNLLFKTLKTDRLGAAEMKKFVQTILYKISTIKSLNSTAVIMEIKASELEIPSLLAKALSAGLPGFSILKLEDTKSLYAEKLIKSARKGLLYELCSTLIGRRQIPVWFGESGSRALAAILNEVVLNHPEQVFQVLKRENISAAQFSWLNETINFKSLIKTIGHLNKAQRTLLQMVQDFYFSLGNLANQAVSAKEIQFRLFKKLIKAWLSGNWKILSADYIWNELIWEICVEKNINQAALIEGFGKIKFQFPPAIQITLTQIEAQQRQLKVGPKKEPVKRKDSDFFINDAKALLKDSIFIQNAGLVLINHYIPMLFERLGLIDESKKYLPDKQQDAVHYLQFVATGLMQTEEPDLVLNKILCGIPLKDPVKNEVHLNNNEVELIEQLLQAMIGYWPAIGSSSIEGFRGNWLLRDGLLIEYDDKWELTIEKRAYDLLINQSPFTFSVIKYPWMSKALYVQWPH